ncbi:MAG TPA: sigma-70 family RNA polymerase sigma factor [Acidimicrobiales bacterium]|nr:sigma-70 family RNA polymerase sigma factor [Acidimicrobiales bacterium]
MAIRADDVDLMRDRALVEQHQAGDAAAFEDLYRRYYGRLFRYCLKRVGDRHEAEELTQEAFTRAYRAMPALRGERRFYPWLSVIASRLCVDTHRRLGRTEPTAEIDAGAVDDGGERRVEAAADRALLGEALRRLSPRHREVLELREQHGWSYQRIAHHYDMSLGAVEGLLFRARQALRREFLAAAGPESGLAAGVPVIGWLVRRLHAARFRLDEAAAGWAGLPALAGNAMGLALVVTTAAGLCTAVVAPAGHRTQVQVAARSIANVSTEPASTGLAARPLDFTPASAHVAIRRGPPQTASSAGTPNAGSNPLSGASLMRAPDAKRRGESNPVNEAAGPVGAGTDPSGIAAATAEHLDEYTHQLNRLKGIKP